MGLFLIKEIKSKDGMLHFRRYRLIQTPWFAVYIHVIYKADEDEDMHDHPWDYTSYVLSGMFYEQTRSRGGRPENKLIGPYMRIKRSAEELHKITELYSKKVVTLFITGKRRREWGYYVDQRGWVDHKTYRINKNKNRNI